MPNLLEFDLYASMRTAKEVGGDFYDIFFMDEDHLALVMAYVSGKGIPAALFMMTGKTMLKALAGVTLENLVLVADIQEITHAPEFVEHVLAAGGCPEKIRNQMQIAVDELFSNICRYSGSAFAEIRCGVAAGRAPRASYPDRRGDAL